MEGLEPRIKVWLEKDGKLVFSGYRAELLRSIRQTGSLAEAAERMGLSYRRAWGKIREIETNLGEPLVESRRGGAKGGRSRLTALGERLLEEFEALLTKASAATAAKPDAFGDSDSPD
jgi:molybdate transport system regulatory protein